MRERRARRSADRFLALGYYLEAVRDRARARAVVLASDDGLVVSGAGAPETNDVLAIVGSSKQPARDLSDALKREGKVHSARIELEGSTYYLASLGGAPI